MTAFVGGYAGTFSVICHECAEGPHRYEFAEMRTTRFDTYSDARGVAEAHNEKFHQEAEPVNNHPIMRFVRQADPADMVESLYGGSWLRFTVLGGNNFAATREIQGVAWVEEEWGLIGVARETTDYARRGGPEHEFAESPTYLNPEHVITVAYAESGA